MRYLVATADERTWPKDQPVLFLGKWCKKYSRKHIWQAMNYEVVSYHWDDSVLYGWLVMDNLEKLSEVFFLEAVK